MAFQPMLLRMIQVSRGQQAWTMAVYTLVSFPDWGLPYGKPRFIITSGGLRILNLPLLSPDTIFARRSIGESSSRWVQ